MKLMIITILLLSLLGACISPDRTYHIYNIVNGAMPNDKSKAEIKGKNIKLEGLVIYQTFEVRADVPQTYEQDATLQGADSILP